MKILHVISSINRGGAENHLVDLALAQSARGDRVSIAYLKGDHYWRKFLSDSGIEAIPLLAGRWYRPIGWTRLARLIRRLKPDVLHCHLPRAEIAADFAARCLDVRSTAFVISKHNDDPFHSNALMRRLGDAIARRADRIIAISESVKANACCSQLKCPDEQVTTIHYGISTLPYDRVDAAAVRGIRSSWTANAAEAFIIGTVARLVPQKALHRLLKAFAAFRAISSSPKRAFLVIVGAGPLEGELRRLTEELGIASSVVWAGFRVDIPEVMSAFDVFALTSVYEGLGLVLLEAMAARRPVVASNVSAMPEIVDDGVTGHLLDTEDAQVVARAFLAYEDRGVREAHGLAGRARVTERFTVQAMTDRTYEAYRLACASREARCDPTAVAPAGSSPP
jgi:glycosyltransferase involved in cell wall biosynthesis